MIDTKAIRAAAEAAIKKYGGYPVTDPAFVITLLDRLEAAEKALAEPVVEPVCWEWRWFDANPNTVTFGQWTEWKRVEPRNRLCTVEDSLNEFRAYIAYGNRYELRALFTSPQPPAEVPLLTHGEVWAIWNGEIGVDEMNQQEAFKFAGLIEQAVRHSAGLV